MKRTTAVPSATVLIVEDERRLRELLSRAVREMDLQALVAGDAPEALRCMEQSPAQAVLLDLMLPGTHGLALLEQLRQRWPATKVVILTAFGDLSSAQRAMRLGAVDFLCKPCPLGELEAALGRALGSSEPAPPTPATPAAPPAAVSLAEVEREHAIAALQRHGGNRVKAAAELGISVRNLYYRLAQWRGA